VEQAVDTFLSEGPVRIERVARRFGYSRQTLYRRLKSEGITYEQVVEDLRRAKALHLVVEGKLTIKEISYRLGFSDPAAFSHAFKRWTGRSARQVRAQPGG
jgi:AraC-like DNA-binding protein